MNDADRASIVEVLLRTHEFFYHFTLDTKLKSIKSSGLDPAWESEESAYAERVEPKALRYCTPAGFEVGRSAANARRSEWSDEMGMQVAGNSRVVLLRTPARILLERSFGLDYSYRDSIPRHLPDYRDGLITSTEFLQVVERAGVISCYDVIPPEHIEVSRNRANADAEFIPLQAWSDVNFECRR